LSSHSSSSTLTLFEVFPPGGIYGFFLKKGLKGLFKTSTSFPLTSTILFANVFKTFCKSSISKTFLSFLSSLTIVFLVVIEYLESSPEDLLAILDI